MPKKSLSSSCPTPSPRTALCPQYNPEPRAVHRPGCGKAGVQPGRQRLDPGHLCHTCVTEASPTHPTRGPAATFQSLLGTDAFCMIRLREKASGVWTGPVSPDVSLLGPASNSPSAQTPAGTPETQTVAAPVFLWAGPGLSQMDWGPGRPSVLQEGGGSHRADSGQRGTSKNTDFLKKIKPRSLGKSLYHIPLSSVKIFFMGL